MVGNIGEGSAKVVCTMTRDGKHVLRTSRVSCVKGSVGTEKVKQVRRGAVAYDFVSDAAEMENPSLPHW